jgi:hypothetical protein
VAAAGGLWYSVRIHELRGQGHVISQRREFHDGQPLFWFRLESFSQTRTRWELLEAGVGKELFPLA